MSRLLVTENKGFSVIETMVALLILMVGILAVSTMYGEGQRVLHGVERQRAALWLTREKIEEKIGSRYEELARAGTGERLADGIVIGEDQTDGMIRTWRVEIDRPQPDIALIHATTRWTERGRSRAVNLFALKAQGGSQ